MFVVDLTPISQRTIEYWAGQGYSLGNVESDPLYQQEILEANEEQVRKGHRPYDPEKFGPVDPAHPYAYTPRYVTFQMRKEQDFRCYVTDWREDDWIFNRDSGELRLVGKLTRDHTLAATRGGETSAKNMKMVCALANRKKGMKLITYEDLRLHLENFWQILLPGTPVNKLTLEQLGKLGVKHVTY